MTPDIVRAEALQWVRFLERRQWPLSDEKKLQVAIADEMDGLHFEYRREVPLGQQGIIDFVVDRIGIEVKIGGSKRTIFRQCESYLKHPDIDGIVIATTKAMGVPSLVEGKPVLIALLGMGAL